MKNTQWIFFDIGSTLVDESIAYRKRIEKTISGTDVSYDDFYNKMVEISKQNQNGYQKALEAYGLTMVPWNSEDEFVYPEAEECLQYLSQKYQIGIIANQVFGSRERLGKNGLLQYIHLVIASAEEGVAKPDLRIFENALYKAGCDANKAVMVGDRLDNDIVPAKRIGMGTIWIQQGFGKLAVPKTKEEQPDYTINHLKELIDLF